MEGAALQRGDALGDELACGSRPGAPARRRTASPCAGSRRSRARRAGRGWRCRRRGWRPCRASSAARRWCRARRRTRCRPSRRREDAGGWWPWRGKGEPGKDAYSRRSRLAPDRGWPPARACGKLDLPPAAAPATVSMSTFRPLPLPLRACAGTDHDALPPGTRFGEFEILRVLGVGGFGIVYLANDHSLEREVALKEYMPASLAARGAGPQITVRSSSFAETYAIGLRSFVNEARLLARFDHPSLVKVYRFWEDNATAYMVMPYLQGVTLRDTRRRDGASARRGLDPQRHLADPVGARAAAPRRRLPPRHRARQHPAAARRPAGAARLRRGAARHQRPHPVAHGDPQAELCADRAVRRDDAAAPGPVDRPLCARRGDPLPAVRRAAGAGDRAGRAGRGRVDREPDRARRVAALPRGRVLDALAAPEPAAAERRAAARGARRPRPDPAARPARDHDPAERRPAGRPPQAAHPTTSRPARPLAPSSRPRATPPS